MLPTRLEIKNFLAYRTPDPILFEGIHLACLCGPNGAGKSSLLDAITWVLWGKARGRSDDDLIHLGQEEMQVTLEFLQGDTRYRVTRKRRLGGMRKDGSRGTGTSSLDLFGWDVEGNTYRVINEPSMRQTEKKIVDLLRLDYETFVNSAFVQQGKADAFTTKTPAERKRILAEILGLNQWEMLEDKVKKRLQDLNTEFNTIQMQLADMEREIAQEPRIIQEYELADAQLEDLREKVREAEDRFMELSGADAEFTAARSEKRAVEHQMEERRRNIAEADDAIRRSEERLQHYETILAQRDEIEQGYTRLNEIREANQALSDALRVQHDIEQRISELTLQIQQARQQIELEITSVETSIGEAQRTVETGNEVSAELENIFGEIYLLEQSENSRDQIQQEISTLKEEQAGLGVENKALRTEMNDIKERIEIIEHTTEALCPLCRQPLDETHRLHLLEDLQQEGKEKGDLFRANDGRMKEIRDDIDEKQRSIQEITQMVAQLPFLRNKRGSLEQQNRDAELANLRVQESQGVLEKLQARLANQDYAHELQSQLTEAQAERDKLAYDRDTHDNVRAMLDELQGYEKRATELESALQSIPLIEDSLRDAQERKNRWQEWLALDEQRLQGIEENLVTLQTRLDEMHRREKLWKQLRTEERNAIEKRTGLKQRLASIDDLRERQKTLTLRQTHLSEQRGVYEQLRNAFGKNGIPAMIIEAAIPELEESTNQLLHRMTDGRMTVRFDTQREKKTGGVAETFDIWIGDELGQRDYSLYSGGEAFRVNFALRVAISQLLARRAGAQLRTLFIDEGFGALDDVGRERLVEAITAIQDDFDLVLVITHIEELKEAFPVRLEIEKSPQGSRIRLGL
ncbi:MAG: SMC family ATPase [Anaerolineae bacterium]|nr:SMC family ATPase [Anaerolineae bacterium]